MKVILTTCLVAISFAVAAQTFMEKSFPITAGQKVEFSFDFPELIKVQTWDKKEILIKGSVSINRGENDAAFVVNSRNDGKLLSISSEIKDRENLPRRTIIKKGDKEYYFKASDVNDPEIKKFLEENGGAYTYMTNGIDIDITLEIFVPKGTESRIDSKFGLVEIGSFDAPLSVNAPHGGVDATITKANIGQLTARTKFGEILTNLDTKFNSTGLDNHDHWTEIQAKLGSGPNYDLESKFGKVYLRKPQ